MIHYAAYLIGFLCGFLAFQTGKRSAAKSTKITIPKEFFAYLIHMNYEYIMFMKAYINMRDTQDTAGLNKLYQACKETLDVIPVKINKQ